MARTLTPERQRLKEWAICLKGCGMTQEEMASRFGVERASIKDWLIGTKINDNPCFILDKQGRIVHNSGVIVENFYDGLPPNPRPQFFVGKADLTPATIKITYYDLGKNTLLFKYLDTDINPLLRNVVLECGLQGSGWRRHFTKIEK